jgi:hypothetical protein
LCIAAAADRAPAAGPCYDRGITDGNITTVTASSSATGRDAHGNFLPGYVVPAWRRAAAREHEPAHHWKAL